MNFKTMALSLSIFTSLACSQESSLEKVDNIQPIQIIKGQLKNETVTYLRYNTEVQPCITLKLDRMDKQKQLCIFTDQQGNAVDVRTDVAGVDYLTPAFSESSFTVTLDLFSYYLDCQITLINKSVKDPVCKFRDMD